MNKYRKILIAFAVMLTGLLLHVFLQGQDNSFFRIINKPHFPWLDQLMLPITYCGNTVILFLGSLVIWRLRGRKTFFQALVSLTIAGLLVLIIKRVFPVLRPSGILQEINILGPYLQKYSFPSGHTAAIFSLAVIIKNKFQPLVPLFLTVAVLVAISRVYVGAHFPSDVIFGAGIGYLTGELVSVLFSRAKDS